MLVNDNTLQAVIVLYVHNVQPTMFLVSVEKPRVR